MSESIKPVKVMTGLRCCSKPDYRECEKCPYNEYNMDCTQILMTEAFEYTKALRTSILKQTLFMLTGKEPTANNAGILSQLAAATAVNSDNCLE